MKKCVTLLYSECSQFSVSDFKRENTLNVFNVSVYVSLGFVVSGDSKTDQDACLSDDGITYDSVKNTGAPDQCSTSTVGGPASATGATGGPAGVAGLNNSNLMDRLCTSQNVAGTAAGAANSVQTKRKDKLRIRSKRKESREVTSHFDDDLDDSTVADVEDPYSDVRSSVVKHR